MQNETGQYDVPRASHASTVEPLCSECRIGLDKIPHSLLHTTDPRLENDCRDSLMEDTMGLEGIVWGLPHEDLCKTKLYVSFRKFHGHRLEVHPPDTLRFANTFFAGRNLALLSILSAILQEQIN